jgi:hypothetical protein
MQNKKNGGAGGSGSPSGQKSGGKIDRTRTGKSADGDRGKQKKKGKFDITKVRCYNCNEKGHF